MSINKKVVWLPYDMDTAIGINNEGAIVFDYSLEDTDHLEGGADVFNGQGSVIWNNLRDAYGDEIKALYQQLRSQGLISYDIVEDAFEEHQDKWPEAIFNEDAYFKYLAPLIAPDSGTEATSAYLHMLQGSKKEQRKWWLYNRFRYMDSKFNAGDALTDVIQLRGYAKDNITLTPYADVYASIKYGSYLVQTRAQRNSSYTLICPLDNVNDTEIYIYSASQLSSIGDLSGLKVGFADFSHGTKLSLLKVGDSSSGYTNPNLKTLYVGTNGLLQTIDVRNCTALGTDEQTTVDLSGATNIENVYFDNTAIKGCTLPNGGILKVLHLPSTITNLTIQNQKAITDFTMPSYSNITTLRLDNVASTIPERTILSSMPANSRIRLTGFTWECEDADEIDSVLTVLDSMRGMDEQGNNLDHAYQSVSGTIHTSTLTGDQIDTFKARGYNLIKFVADTLTTVLTYKTWNGSSVIKTVTCNNGVPSEESPSVPSRTQTDQYTFTPAGWSTEQDSGEADASSITNVTENRSVYAAYNKVLRNYTVTWKNEDGTVLETDTSVPYGSIPIYNGTTPTYQGETATGWYPSVSEITGNTIYTAVYVPTYRVRFYDYDGTLLQTSTVREGESATYTGETPTSSAGEFLGWDPEPTNINSDTDCYAYYVFNIVKPDLKYLVYTKDDTNMTMTITGLNVANIVADNLSVITIPDTIDGYHVILN